MAANGNGFSAAETIAAPRVVPNSAARAAHIQAAQTVAQTEKKCYTIGRDDYPFAIAKVAVQHPNLYNKMCHAIPVSALLPGAHSLEFAADPNGRCHEEIAYMFGYIHDACKRMGAERRRAAPQDSDRFLPDAFVTLEVGMKPPAAIDSNVASIEEVGVIPFASQPRSRAALERKDGGGGGDSSSSAAAAAAAPAVPLPGASETATELVHRERAATRVVANQVGSGDEDSILETEIPGLERVVYKKSSVVLNEVTGVDANLMDVLRLRLYFRDPNRPYQPDSIEHEPEDDEPGIVGRIMAEYFEKLKRDEEKERKKNSTKSRNRVRETTYKNPFYRITSEDRLIELCTLYSLDSTLKNKKDEILQYPLDHILNPINLLSIFSEQNCTGLFSIGIMKEQQRPYTFGIYPVPYAVWRLAEYSWTNLSRLILPFYDLETFEDETLLNGHRTALLSHTPEFMAKLVWNSRMNSGGVYPTGEDLGAILRAIRAAHEGPVGCDLSLCTSAEQKRVQMEKYTQLMERGKQILAEQLQTAGTLVKQNVYVNVRNQSLASFDELRKANQMQRSEIDRKSRVFYTDLVEQYKRERNVTQAPEPYTEAHDQIQRATYDYRCNLLLTFRRKALVDFDRIMKGHGQISSYSEKIRLYIADYLSANKNFNLPRYRLWTNLGTFGEWMSGWKLELEYAHRFGHTHNTFILLFLGAMHIYSGDAFQPHTFLYGGKSTGKSHSALMLAQQLIPGTVETFVYTSMKAEAATGDRNDGIEIYEETPPSFLGNITGGKGTGEMENMIKSRLTSGKVIAKVLEIDPITKQRRTEVYVGLCNSMMILCSNDGLDAVSDPMQSRLFKKHAVSNPEFSEKILAKSMRGTHGEGFTNYVLETIRRTRRNHALTWLIEKLIYTCTLMDVDTRLGEHYAFSALHEASQAGLNNASDVRNFQRYRMILKTTTILNAIDLVFDLDPYASDAKFAIVDMLRVEPHLCVTTEIAVFALTLTAFQYEDPVEKMVRVAIRNKYFPNNEDSEEYQHWVSLPNVDRWRAEIQPDGTPALISQQSQVAWRPLVRAQWRGSNTTVAVRGGGDRHERYQKPDDTRDLIGKFANQITHEIGGKAEFKDVCYAIRSLIAKTNTVAEECRLPVGGQSTVDALTLKGDELICSRAWIFAPLDTSPIERALTTALSHPYASESRTYILGSTDDSQPYVWPILTIKRTGDPVDDMQEINNPFLVPVEHQTVLARLHGRKNVNDYDSSKHTFDVRNIIDTSPSWKMDTTYDDFFMKLYLKNAGWTMKMIKDNHIRMLTPEQTDAFWEEYFITHPDEKPTSTYQHDMQQNHQVQSMLDERGEHKTTLVVAAAAAQRQQLHGIGKIIYICHICGFHTEREFGCTNLDSCKKVNREQWLIKRARDLKHAEEEDIRKLEASIASGAADRYMQMPPNKRVRVEEVPKEPAPPPVVRVKLTRYGNATTPAERAANEELYMEARREGLASVAFDDCQLW